MFRVEIIANQSVQDDILEALEDNIPNILYTIIPLVQGRGEKDRKLGTTTWPETNFLIISYVKNKQVPIVKAVISAIKEKFNNEGIKMFLVKATKLEPKEKKGEKKD